MSDKGKKRDIREIYKSVHPLIPTCCKSTEPPASVEENGNKEVDPELMTEIHPLLTAFLFTGLDFRSPKRRQSGTSNKIRETAIRGRCMLKLSWLKVLMCRSVDFRRVGEKLRCCPLHLTVVQDYTRSIANSFGVAL
ncbi:hypothetical protein TNCV_1554351 [Trichonephila clavipes]|nr:hypothetical protein TNCV_1554351 [Trichonephila clavipes]